MNEHATPPREVHAMHPWAAELDVNAALVGDLLSAQFAWTRARRVQA